MRNLLGILLLLLSVPMQVSLKRLTGLHWDLPLIAIYFCGLYFGKSAGIAIGASLGLFLDGCSLGPVGQHLISRSLEGYLAGALGEKVYLRGALFHFFSLFTFAATTYTIEWLLASLAGPSLAGGASSLLAILPQVFLTAAFGMVVVLLLTRTGFAPQDLSYFPHR